ncbi:hypothetical protein PRZ48_014203 [Zasmidium cellare]|uniref:Major facilitator superfamily (MFS) profile domain-containing protein n=1 Tax=Zasmidium cellare TaxID=395010 RepID=A0ABR0E098_ZASCE|nr:hypothetical protein PRZ48_014203 [Zasmidium cellare]
MLSQHKSSGKLWQRLSAPRLMTLVTAVSACAIAYEGMSQGVIGAVNSTPEFIHRMGYGTRDGTVTNPTKQGGIASIYYAGSLLGAFWAGQFADRYGRIKGLWMASLWCMTGVILQAASTNLAFILVARIIAGVGVAFLIVIAPLWTAELSPAAHRGRVICLTFLANFSGIAFEAWLGYGLSFTKDIGHGQFRWRFLFATQTIPIVLLVLGTLIIPESPRWLVKNGRADEALAIITKLRGNDNPEHPDVIEEYKEIIAVVEMEHETSSSNYFKMFFGIGSGDMNLGRRIQLAFWLQVLMQYGTGIAAVVIYSGTIFRTAGFDAEKAGWMTALSLSLGIIGTAINAALVDRLGRRITIYWGSAALSVILFIIGGMQRAAYDNPDSAQAYGTAAAAFVFIYVLVFSASWLMIPFIYPTEIFPTWMRAKGNAFGVAGWAIGYGGGSLLVPVMFSGISEKTFYVFGAAMIVYIPLTFVFVPETAGRSLEQIDFLFASKSPFTWKEEEEFQKRMEILQQRLGTEHKMAVTEHELAV